MDDADDAGPRDPDLGGQEGKIQPDFVAIARNRFGERCKL